MEVLELILQPFHHFTYITAHSADLPLLCLCHSSFSNPSVILSTSQLILQTFHCFTYVTAHFPTLLLLLLRHRLFTYVTWQTAHESQYLVTLWIHFRLSSLWCSWCSWCGASSCAAHFCTEATVSWVCCGTCQAVYCRGNHLSTIARVWYHVV